MKKRMGSAAEVGARIALPQQSSESTEQQNDELEQVASDISSALRLEETVLRRPVPIPSRTKRAKAGVHTNPLNKTRSLCNAVSLSPEVLSQVITTLGCFILGTMLKK